MNRMRYAVVIEREQRGYGAYVPDLPGVISVGASAEEVTANIRDAIALHLEGLREQGLGVPEPTTLVTVIDADDAA